MWYKLSRGEDHHSYWYKDKWNRVWTHNWSQDRWNIVSADFIAPTAKVANNSEPFMALVEKQIRLNPNNDVIVIVM